VLDIHGCILKGHELNELSLCFLIEGLEGGFLWRGPVERKWGRESRVWVWERGVSGNHTSINHSFSFTGRSKSYHVSALCFFTKFWGHPIIQNV